MTGYFSRATFKTASVASGGKTLRSFRDVLGTNFPALRILYNVFEFGKFRLMVT